MTIALIFLCLYLLTGAIVSGVYAGFFRKDEDGIERILILSIVYPAMILALAVCVPLVFITQIVYQVVKTISKIFSR